MDLMDSIAVSASGMAAQSTRMKVASENIANVDSLVTPEGGPYRRQIITFETVLNRNTGLNEVKVRSVKDDMQTPLNYEYSPNHELADANGYVAKPNVSTMIEKMDVKDASRAYEANMAAIESAKEMMVRSIDLLQ